jgi:Capsule assembly protein Wzi
MNEKGSVNARVLEGFAKLTQYNVEAGGGRESLWSGPGFNGSMLLSTNGRPFDLIKAGAAEQFTLPWIFKYQGPMKLTYFLGQLGGDGQFPHTKLTGLRLNLTSASFLELGFSRVVQFNGEGRPALGFGDYLPILFEPGSDDVNSALNNYTLLSADFSLRLPNVSRYLPLFRDVALWRLRMGRHLLQRCAHPTDARGHYRPLQSKSVRLCPDGAADRVCGDV